MTGNLIGEQFDQYVFNQIKVRQELNASGFSSLKTPNQIQILNNKNSFIKLASGVDLFQKKTPPPGKPTLKDYQQAERDGIFDENDLFYMSGQPPVVDTAAKKKYQEYREQVIANNKNQLYAGQVKLKNLGFSEAEIKSLGYGSKLAQNSILFGGLGSLDKNSNTFSGTSITQRSSISTSANLWNYNSAYGLGGPQFGKQPMPGITSAKVDCINRGSIRTATIQIKAYNTFQFQLLEMLYLRLGFTMMLEWGHGKYLSEYGLESVEDTIIEKYWFSNASISQLDMLKLIEEERKKYSANYDGFFGRVTNFSWKFSPDGTYDITLKLSTLGDIIESLQINIPSPIKSYSKSAKEVLNAPNTIQTWLDDFIKNDKNNFAIFNNGNYINLSSLNYKKRSTDEIFDFRYKDINGNTTLLTGTLESLESTLKTQFSNKAEIPLIGTINIPENEQQKKEALNDALKSLRSVAKGNFGVTNGLTKENSYYVTFGELLNKIYNNILPRVHNNGGDALPILGMGLSEKLNIISAQPNQISFDPNTCFVKPMLYAVGIETPSTLTTSGIKDFFKLEKDGDNDIFYGQLMNVYLNFNFIKKQLQKSNKGGVLSLYNFLEGICDGINTSLGDVNKIEPIINADINEIIFIDQNPIKGNPQILKKLLEKVPDPVEIIPFEIYGINQSKSLTQSNFVKSFTFDTKIDKNLASMITIGTTAGQGTSKIIDGTAFSNWNSGLEDRFQKSLLPAPGFLSEAEVQKEVEEETEAKLRAEFDTYWGDVKKPTSMNNFTTEGADKGYYNTGENTNGNELRWAQQRSKNDTGGTSGAGTKFLTFYNFKTGKYKGYSFINQSRSNAFDGYLTWKKTKGKDIIAVQDVDLKASYQTWLCYALSGKIVGKQNTEGGDFAISLSEALYLNLDNKQFYNQGKQAFKEYIKLRDQKIYRITGNPSNQQGFIPVELGLTLDGISGVKIYQKININQKFLPLEYQSNLITNTLDFVIKTVNHQIKDEKWETQLSTISIPPSGPQNTELIDNGLFTYLTLDENNVSNQERSETGDSIRIPVDQLSPDNFIKEELKKSEGYYSGGKNRVFRSSTTAYAYPDPKTPSKITEIKSKPNYIQGEENEPWTIGYGQTYYAQGQEYTRNGGKYLGLGSRSSSPVKEGDSITKASAEIGFEKVLEGIAKTMVGNNRIRVPLTQNEYNALLSFSYNSGPGITEAKKPLYDLINAKDYTSAGFKLETTLTNKGLLTSRRMKEADIWFTNNPGNPT